MASSPHASRQLVGSTPALIVLASLLVLALVYRGLTATNQSNTRYVQSAPVGASAQGDLPTAPDYVFVPAPAGAAPSLPSTAVVALARDAAPNGFVGKAPVVRYLIVKSHTLDYGPTFVVFSADATPIVPFGAVEDAKLIPIVATYSWVFLSPSGDFLGATRAGYPSDPPAFPAE